MKKIVLIITLIILSGHFSLFSQADSAAGVYLLTCVPGTAAYSIYGHSALRIVDSTRNSDLVYNWGVFDFSTPNFVWKFAKGRLDYMLGVYPYDKFLKEYFFENRSVHSQKVNLEQDEIAELMSLINENLRPENISYRYDFFYDDCSTRIRDLFEKVLGEKLIYPPDETNDAPTFREKIAGYSGVYPWLRMGIDLLMGTPGDKKAFFRDRMFLPDDLQLNLAQAVVNRDRKMTPLMQPVQYLLEFDPPVIKSPFYSSPFFTFTMLFILLLFVTTVYRGKTVINYIDILIFFCFSIISVMMIFFNFFTDHLQMKMNLNIVWFNPLILICLYCTVFNRRCKSWYRYVFYLSLVILPFAVITPDRINIAFVPLVLILTLRSAARSGFSWNPLSVELSENQ